MALDIQAMAQRKQHPLKGYKPASGAQILEELRAAQALVAAKATRRKRPPSATGWSAGAQAAAEAAKDGGFMGFHAKRISDGEQAMLDQVRQAVSGDGSESLTPVGSIYVIRQMTTDSRAPSLSETREQGLGSG